MQERRTLSTLTDPGASTARRRAGLIAVISMVVLAADQITKTLAVRDLVDGPVHVIGPFSFSLGFNTGIAFSLLTGVGLPVVLLAVCLVGVVVWFARGMPTAAGSTAIALVIGGATGNLVDRIFRQNGAVVDFIHTGFWPTFNVADTSVVCGCVLFATIILRSEYIPGPRDGQDPTNRQAL